MITARVFGSRRWALLVIGLVSILASQQASVAQIFSNGDVFVADGHVNNRIVKFSPQGKFIKQWGKKGASPGEFKAIYEGERMDVIVLAFVYDLVRLVPVARAMHLEKRAFTQSIG